MEAIRKYKLCRIVLATVIFYPLPSLSTTYLVDPSEHPDPYQLSRNLQDIANSLKPGDEMVFKDGLYTLANSFRIAVKGTKEKPIIFRAQKKHQARIFLPLEAKGDATVAIGIFSGKWNRNQEMFVVIEGFDISGGKQHGIQSAGGGHLTIRNNRIHDTGFDAVKINSGADFTTIEFNEIFNTGLLDSCPSNSENCNSEGIDITSSDNVHVLNNHVHDIKAWGIYTKKGSKNNIIEKNLIHDVIESGIGLGESTVTYNSIAKNNILYNIAMSCIQASGAKDSQIVNNTCYNTSYDNGKNWAGFRITYAEHTKGALKGDDIFTRNLVLKNNLVVLNNSDGVCLKITHRAFDPKNDITNLNQLKSDSNLCFNLQDSKYKWIAYGQEFVGIENWQKYTESIGAGQDKSSVVNNPLFLSVNPSATSDFLHLSIESPARNMGEILEAVVDDFDSRLRTHIRDRIDIGAYNHPPTEKPLLR